MNQKSPFPNVDAHLVSLQTQYHPIKAKFLAGVSILKVSQDLNGGQLDLNNEVILSIYAHMMQEAAKNAGCTIDEVVAALTAVVVAVSRDVALQPDQEEPAEQDDPQRMSEIEGTVIDLLRRIAAETRH